MNAVARTLTNQALRLGVITGGVICGAVLYRKATTMNLDYSGDPFPHSDLADLETVVFAVGLTIGLCLIGWCTVGRILSAIDVQRPTDRLPGRSVEVCSIASSALLIVVGLALGIGCQIAADEAQTTYVAQPAAE